jgi:hypothetical protein
VFEVATLSAVASASAASALAVGRASRPVGTGSPAVAASAHPDLTALTRHRRSRFGRRDCRRCCCCSERVGC